MSTILSIVQMIVALLLIGTILLQATGTGLGSAWGGGGETYRSKRGVEKIILIFTIVLVFLFLVISLISIMI